MSDNSHHPDTTQGGEASVSGDPGVGGILADPLATPTDHEQPDPEAGPPSPNPSPPKHHGEWMPTEKNSDI